MAKKFEELGDFEELATLKKGEDTKPLNEVAEEHWKNNFEALEKEAIEIGVKTYEQEQREKDKVYTEDDKLSYITSLCAGERFEKTYELYGGKIKLRFRGMTNEEYRMLDEQLLIDVKKDPTKISDVIYNDMRVGYVLCASLKVVVMDDKVIDIPEVTTFHTKKNETKYPKAFDNLMSKVLTTQALYDLAVQHYLSFSLIETTLASEANTPDFC